MLTTSNILTILNKKEVYLLRNVKEKNILY